ncbi:hypothetical protein Patl1_24872 [Pistacia atlantica]|uniref:Uncharacterized protein n=1 Tax=Pistacia atlantica TaxID=434234 RepID=A0ACC1B2X5_9ROSI|nr:hypothetical protein Patl1_24872 [Pistacia atlantica]
MVMERLKSFRYVSQVLTIYLVVGTCSGKSVPAIFVFGDSLADAGNNFYIKTIAKPVSPNGIDFGTTGEELGFENLTPSYLAPTTVGDMILKGVNYASSGAGLLNETGAFFGDLINFDMQISYFEKTRQDIISRIGEQAAKSLLTQSLYFLAIGSNDILNFKANTLGKNLSSDAYTDNVISRFRFQLTRLYNLDARKIIVANIGAAGCIPYTRDINPPGNECIASVNEDARLYNNKLKALLDGLTLSNTESKYVYADAYAIFEDILQNYASYGFDIADNACCHIAGTHGGLFPCLTGAQVCDDRSKYVFWDAFHPSYAANIIAAKHLMDGGSNFISPLNIRQLVMG